MAMTHGRKDTERTAHDRKARLKAALKANMAKRKTQTQARAKAEKGKEQTRTNPDN